MYIVIAIPSPSPFECERECKVWTKEGKELKNFFNLIDYLGFSSAISHPHPLSVSFSFYFPRSTFYILFYAPYSVSVRLCLSIWTGSVFSIQCFYILHSTVSKQNEGARIHTHTYIQSVPWIGSAFIHPCTVDRVLLYKENTGLNKILKSDRLNKMYRIRSNRLIDFWMVDGRQSYSYLLSSSQSQSQ